MTTAEIDRKEADAPKLPRRQQGSQPQHLLLTILGDFWYARRECLPTRALVTLLGEFGISHQGSRTAISRLVHRGLLEFNRARGTGGYQLTSYADEVIRDGLRRISQFGNSSKDWDGEWTLVTFSIPESQRHLRHMLRTRLRWLGFAPLYNGIWVSPWDRADEVVQLLSGLNIFSVSIFHAKLSVSSPDSPVSAWDLDVLAGAFNEFIEEFAPLVRSGRRRRCGRGPSLWMRGGGSRASILICPSNCCRTTSRGTVRTQCSQRSTWRSARWPSLACVTCWRSALPRKLDWPATIPSLPRQDFT
jgi:phenylacetic acid degradation operon negative regulatory protein